MLEGKSQMTGLHYALLYQETPGAYTQKLTNAPDRNCFVADMLIGQHFGTFAGRVLRESGIPVVYEPGAPPSRCCTSIGSTEKFGWTNTPRC